MESAFLYHLPRAHYSSTRIGIIVDGGEAVPGLRGGDAARDVGEESVYRQVLFWVDVWTGLVQIKARCRGGSRVIVASPDAAGVYYRQALEGAST
jgi:hypothetical protein